MAGRIKDSSESKIEKAMRTKAWFAFVLNQSGFDNTNQLAQTFNEGTRKWSNYSGGINSPNKVTLRRCEKLYKGSCSVFREGPDQLFLSMFMSLKETAELRFFLSSTHNWLSNLKAGSTTAELIVYLENTVIEKSFYNKPYEVDPISPINFLGGCSLLLRQAIISNNYSDRNIHDLVDLIIDIIEADDLSAALENHNIKRDYTYWLLFSVLSWASDETLYLAELFVDLDYFDGRYVNLSPKIMNQAVNIYLENPRALTSKLNKAIEIKYELDNAIQLNPDLHLNLMDL